MEEKPMCLAIEYNSFIRSKNQVFDVRLRMVKRAQAIGIRPAAREMEVARNTVRKWLNRYEEEGKRGLFDRSRRPHSSPGKIPPAATRTIRYFRKKSGMGAQRMKMEFELPHSSRTIHKVIKQAGMVRKRRRKHHTKRDLRAEKAKRYKPMTYYQLDVKYLTDIPQYYRFMVQYRLPRYQYTIREVRGGAMFLGYGHKYNATYSSIFTDLFMSHLRRQGVDLKRVIIQTDNGPEFSGTEKYERERGFHYRLEKLWKCHHRYIPPGLCNANADVETVHALIENEFFDIESFSSRREFFDKVYTYQFWFNHFRKNSYKGWKAPRELYEEWLPNFDRNYLNFKPVDLDAWLPVYIRLLKNSRPGVTMSVHIPPAVKQVAREK